MDTTTVLEIIKRLDSHIKVITEEYRDIDMDHCYWIKVGKEQAFTDLRDHLQSFIEGQLNALENQTPEQ